MPVAYMLVDAVAKNELMSFMDGFSGYNQIKIAEKYVSKITFRCPGAIGTFEWLVMPFGLKNASATYQRVMNTIFHDMIGQCLERGVEVDKNNAKAIMAVMPLKNKKKLQRFLGQILSNTCFTGLFSLGGLENGRWHWPSLPIYCPQKSMKGQAVADFLADHPMVDVAGSAPVDIPVFCVNQSWTLKFYGSSTERASGVEYEALVIGLEILRDLGAKDVLIIGDSRLVLKQMSGEYKCSSLALAPYFTAASQLLDDFEDVTFQHVPRQDNWEDDELAQIASRGIQVDTFDIDVELAGDRREERKDALRNDEQKLHYGLKMRILHYVLMEDELYRKGDDDFLLRCLGFPEAMRVMQQVHEGLCGAHQSGIKMRLLICRHGHYWPSMLNDCIIYSRGCQQCQKHGNIQRMPADEMHTVIKPWPFKGWAMDLIGKIYPPSSKEKFLYNCGY
ncbi:uncharacterized protein LOC142537688 [Primulina tabacum]|uniref:uncharacterized protein LOC142537688 n=1 Tax=Primulina tabacum TaxID=48773 RepID=UPI003F5A3BEA